MTVIRLRLRDPVPDDGRLVVRGREHRYLSRVRRARPGEPVEVLDGAGLRLRGTIGSIGPQEAALVAHLRGAELYASVPPKNGVFAAPIDFPPHERCVELEIEVGNGTASATVIGGDLTHEYVSENADYRS